MKPCNESEIVGIKSMGHSKDYYVGYDAAEKNYIRILNKIRAEIEEVELNIAYKENYKVGGTWGLRKALEIIDKYRDQEDKDADSN